MLSRLKPLLATALLASLLTACGSGTSGGGSGPVTDSAPKAGGRLVLGENGDEPACLDPHQLSTTNTTVVDRPIFDSLLWQDEGGTLKPWLASAWRVSGDGLTYTFTLRDGVKFHDGAPWNAEALKLNLEHMRDPATKSPLAAGYIAPYKDSEVKDEHTLEVRLSSPYSAFLNVLAQSYLAMISPKQLKEDPGSTCEHPVGSGPFVFEKWTKGQSITYRKNPDYAWGPPGQHAGAAYLDGLEIRFLLSGEVDVIDNTPPSDVQDVKSNQDLNFTTIDRPGHPFSVWLNTGRAPFGDQRVRQALTLAVDRKAIIDSVSFGQWKLATSFVTPSTPDHAEGGQIGYDPAKAAKLLDEAGWTGKDKDGIRTKDGKRLTAYFPIAANFPAQRMQIAVQTQAAAKKAGIDIQMQTPPEQEITDRLLKGDYDLTSGLWATNTADVLWIQYSSKNITTDKRRGQNVARLRDDKIDELLEKARSDRNPAALYDQAQARLVELAPAIPYYDDPRPVSYQKKVHDLTFTPAYPSPYFYDTWLDR
jgi:peptide/nickel transport system substrate-binding protein